MYGPQATLSWVDSNTFRLTFNEAPIGVETTDFRIRLHTVSNDCSFWNTGNAYEAGVGLTYLRPVSGSTTQFDVDFTMSADLDQGATFYTLEIAGSYDDEWGNVSSNWTHQPEMWISRWCNV